MRSLPENRKTLSELLTVPTRRTLGLMSGTSMDGLDIACCEVALAEKSLRTIAATTIPYPTELRNALAKIVSSGKVRLVELVALSTAWGEFAAESVDQFLSDNDLTDKIDLIGSHGQTAAHLSEPLDFAGGSYRGSLQIGDAEIIAKRLGVVTISDFRSGDLAVGGSGAPLAPIYHQQRFAAPNETRLIVNIGGIANVTLLEGADRCIASDVGPGNCLIDYIMQSALDKPFDEDGEVAAQGEVDQELLERLATHSLFQRPLPGSLDRAEVLKLLDEIPPEMRAKHTNSLIATLTELTARLIAQQTARLSEKTPDGVFVCGGGRFNQTLMKHLRNYFSGSIVSGTESLGADPRFVEAECFAWLANLTLESKAGNLPQVTGASRSVVLGKISLP